MSLLILIIMHLIAAIPCLLVIGFAYWVVLFVRRFFTKKPLTKKQSYVLLAVIVIVYLLIGTYFFYSYLLFPQYYDPMYIEWLKQTPTDEIIFDIVFWAFLWFQTFYLSVIDPMILKLMHNA